MTVYYSADPSEIPFNPDEAVRYAGGCIGEGVFKNTITECKDELWPEMRFRAAAAEYGIRAAENGCLDLKFARVRSSDLSRRLRGCDRIILFAATAGYAPEIMARKFSVNSPVKALCAEAVGSAAIESYCDILEKRFTEGKRSVKPRFSPGYGDLSLTLQRDIADALQMWRVGISLAKSGALIPAKSVTAIIGFSDN